MIIKPPTVHIQNAYLAYKHSVIFKNFNLTLNAGKITCLLGPSGVGKSTLLRMIANLPLNDSECNGKIYCDNDIPLSEQISYMAQTDLLMPWLSILNNALLGPNLQGKKSLKQIALAKKLLTKVGLKTVMEMYPHQLSGGMRQRVALVRTLLQNKDIVLMDEPFSSLDTITRFHLQTLTAKLLKNCTVLLVTHDPMEALRLADTIYILSGCPAKLSLPIELRTPTPRDTTDPQLIEKQIHILRILTQAGEFIL